MRAHPTKSSSAVARRRRNSPAAAAFPGRAQPAAAVAAADAAATPCHRCSPPHLPLPGKWRAGCPAAPAATAWGTDAQGIKLRADWGLVTTRRAARATGYSVPTNSSCNRIAPTPPRAHRRRAVVRRAPLRQPHVLGHLLRVAHRPAAVERRGGQVQQLHQHQDLRAGRLVGWLVGWCHRHLQLPAPCLRRETD
jgi:hypothetical protein